MVRANKKMAIPAESGGFRLRIYTRKGSEKKMARILVKCGCCDAQLDIRHDFQTLEINGVIGSLDEWRSILFPLLTPIEQGGTNLRPPQNTGQI